MDKRKKAALCHICISFSVSPFYTTLSTSCTSARCGCSVLWLMPVRSIGFGGLLRYLNTNAKTTEYIRVAKAMPTNTYTTAVVTLLVPTVFEARRVGPCRYTWLFCRALHAPDALTAPAPICRPLTGAKGFAPLTSADLMACPSPLVLLTSNPAA